MSIIPRWRNNEAKMVKAEWRYRRYRAWCLGGPPPSDPPRPLNIWKWKPYEATGFTKKLDHYPSFKCKRKGTVASEVVLKKHASVLWRGWFSIIGVGLDNSQTQTRSTSLRIIPDSGKTAIYCSSRISLQKSPLVREVK